MKINRIFSEYGLIGDDLELKKNVLISIDENGRIQNIKSEKPEESLSFGKNQYSVKLLIPGLINSHVHIGDSFAKEFGYNKNLIEIVAPPDGLKHKLLRSIPKKIKIVGIEHSINEMIRNGITCFNDFREEGIEGVRFLQQVLKSTPIRNLIFGRYNSKEEISQVMKEADGIGLSSYSKVTKKEIRLLENYKSKFKKQIACHIAEDKRDLNLFEDIMRDKIVDIFIHGTKFQKYELERIKQSNKHLILCPRSNAYFAVGLPPILEINNQKIPVSLGTDNIMVNSPNLFEEMRFTYYSAKILQEINNLQRFSLNPKDLLKMITLNAAKTFNMESSIGSISTGKLADFFTLNLNDINFYVDKLHKDLFHAFIIQRTNPINVKEVYIGGIKVYERDNK